jgi:hypothetical protein
MPAGANNHDISLFRSFEFRAFELTTFELTAFELTAFEFTAFEFTAFEFTSFNTRADFARGDSVIDGVYSDADEHLRPGSLAAHSRTKKGRFISKTNDRHPASVTE